MSNNNNNYYEEPFCFQAGSLGHLEGLKVCSSFSGNEVSCKYFGGVPYALPPIGPYRFRRPRKLPDQYRYGTKTSPGRFTRRAAYCPQPGFRNNLFSPQEEDCLQLNIYIPGDKVAPTPAGWPVFFYIHGGFLQWGTPNMTPAALTPLLSESALNAIIVMPGYRLNLFGFLASAELQHEAESDGECAGNMGFWDQRVALEWTANNVGFFGGDAGNITVGGYSAGAHSAFHQLAHELYFVPENEAVIRRIIMWSNSPGVQPRTVQEHQAQFDELLAALSIPKSLSGKDKLTKLRSLPIEELVRVQDNLTRTEFRATSDDAFVSRDLIHNISAGDFGRRMQRRRIRLMNGECKDEHHLYQAWRTPAPSYEAVRIRLIADYPEDVVNGLMKHYCGGTKSLPPGVTGWQDLFGRMYADMQVHHLERGFQRALEVGGLKFGTDVLKYRINWRARCLDNVYPPGWGVTHATDMAIWFWGLDYGEGLTGQEKQLLMPWNQAFASFVHDEAPRWGTNDIRDMKRLRSDGGTDLWEDDQWSEGLHVWDLVNGKAVRSESAVKPKL